MGFVDGDVDVSPLLWEQVQRFGVSSTKKAGEEQLLEAPAASEVH